MKGDDMPSMIRGILIGTMISCVMWAAIFALAEWALAGSYTVTTTADQDAALVEMTRQATPSRPGAGAAAQAVTPQQVIQGMVDRSLGGKVAQIERVRACGKVADVAVKKALGCPVK